MLRALEESLGEARADNDMLRKESERVEKVLKGMKSLAEDYKKLETSSKQDIKSI